MTLANKITIARICLIPVFFRFARRYGVSRTSGHPREVWRRLAFWSFLSAAATDGLDGCVARAWDQKSRLGAILDPLADKGLSLAAAVALGQDRWADGLPLWYTRAILLRDAGLVLGFLLLTGRVARPEVRPSKTGKAAMVLQMMAMLSVLLKFQQRLKDVVLLCAATFTTLSGLNYLRDGIRQAQLASRPTR